MIRAFPILAACLIAAIVLGARVFGPADLYEKDQPKTIAYTADIVLHGRYALPRDMLYQPATKPPLYNWIDAVVVRATGSWDEWALKLPSLLAALATGAMVFGFVHQLAGDRPERFYLGGLASAIFFTFGSDITNGSVIRLSYLARPDMLQCSLLTGAWVCATNMVRECPRRQRGVWIGLFWLCVSGAALTKGPMALTVIVYAIALTFIVKEKGRFAWLLGAPVPILLAGAWLYFAYQQDPAHVRGTIFGAEIVERLTQESPEGTNKPFYFAAMWFVTKTLPWGLLAMIGLVGWAIDSPTRRLMLAPGLWLAIVLIAISIPAGKRIDYLLPAYPPAAVFATAVLARTIRRPRASRFGWMLLAPALLAIGLAIYHLTHFHEARSHQSDRAIAFAKQVRAIVKDDPTLVIVRGKHPLITLLGRHQGSYLTPESLASSRFVILPADDVPAAPVLRSEPVWTDFELRALRPIVPLGLYRTSDIPLETLIERQRQIGEWDRAENPYHAPGTVFQDE